MRVSANDPIDLQIHTIYSDGHWQPDVLFAYLADVGFRLVSITDHDSMDHLDELQALATQHGVQLLPGVEMTTNWRGHSAHLLCYAAQFTRDELAQLARRTEADQLANTRAVYEELLHRGCKFSPGEALPHRPIDNARLLLAHSYAPTLDDALRMIADAGYRSITAPLVDVVAAAHVCGALAVLAHPGRGGGEIHQFALPQLAELLDDVPLDGIEARYPTYSEEQVVDYTVFAQERSLLVSAGSDSHGPQQRLPVPYPASDCSALLTRCDVVVE